MKGEILCSVALISYNQESTIKECLQSVLAQRIDGILQVVIADDASSDRTFDIVKTFLEDQRVVWKILPREINLGMLKNWARAIDACDGEFIALLEGDDSWIMPDKLATQIKALQLNPSLQAVVSDAIVQNERDLTPMAGYVTKYNQETIITLSEVLIESIFPTCSTVFRRNPTHFVLPKFYWQSPYADWVVHVVNASIGNILFLPIQTCKYRLHSKGEYGRLSRIEHLERSLWLLNRFLEFYPRHRNVLLKKRRDLIYALAELYLQKGLIIKYIRNRINRLIYG